MSTAKLSEGVVGVWLVSRTNTDGRNFIAVERDHGH